MLDLAWSEIALIAVVALVVIGPKDLPEAVRGVARGVQKLRRMASEFQGHVDEVVREAKLEEVRDQIRDIRNFDIKGEIEKHVDKDGDLRRTFQEDPLRDSPTSFTTRTGPAGPGAADSLAGAGSMAGSDSIAGASFGPPAPEPPPALEPAAPAAPAFIPPAFIPPDAAAAQAAPPPPSAPAVSADSHPKPTPPTTSA